MKLGALVLDYDGTIATDGVLDAGVRDAIVEARGRGVVVLLVTGRILADLQRLVPGLGLFDAVVAENGAVYYFPHVGDARPLAPPPPSTFLEELGRRRVPFLAGQCVVETDAVHAHDVLAAVRELELPLALLFNRGRLMVLPQSVSKATGLREACRALRLSLHNAVGIGDAENDHEMLAACQLGVAVAWGSAALRAAADEVLPGEGPHAVADFVRTLAQRSRIPASARSRHRVHLGLRAGGESLTLALRGRNVLIGGDPRSGKSWLAGLLCEEYVLQHYSLCVIDPEGDYAGLESLPGVIVLKPEPGAVVRSGVERLLHLPDVSVVVDLSSLGAPEKRVVVPELLRLVKDARRKRGLPHRLVVDEAHYFLHAPGSAELLDLELCGTTLVTYRASQLDPDVLRSAEAILTARESDPAECAALHALCAPDMPLDEWTAALSELVTGEAALLPGAAESGRSLVRFRIARRLTAHVRHRAKYLDAEVEASRAFVFTCDGRATGRVARSLQGLLDTLCAGHAGEFDQHLSRSDFSNWIAHVFADRILAAEVRAIEQAWRDGSAPAVCDRIARTIRARYSSERIMAGM